MIAGKIGDKKKIMGLIKKYFENIKDQPVSKPEKFINSNYLNNILYVNKKTDQTNLVVSYPAYKANYTYRYELELLAMIMGGMMSSRLFSEIREKRGLACGVRAFIDSYLDTGSFLVSVGLEPKKADLTVKLIKKLMIESVNISDDEFTRARQKIISNLALQTEDAGSLAFMFLDQIIYQNKITTPREQIKIFNNIKKKDVENEARKLFSNSPKITLIGPQNININKIK